MSAEPLSAAAFGAEPLDSPRCSRMAATNSLLRIPEAPSTPICLASARSSGSTIVDNDAARSPEATSAVGAVSAVGVLVDASSAAGVEMSEFTEIGSCSFSPLPPAVIRSVSVTDFLSFPR